MRLRPIELLVTVLLLGVPVAAVAIDCTPTTPGVPSCTDLCLAQATCGQTLEQCQDACASLQANCSKSAHPSTFAAYATCAADAGFTCLDSGGATANAACLGVQNSLVECEVVVDGGFEVPDAELVADESCVGVSAMMGGCTACCQSHHKAGAATFLAVALSCECGDGGACTGPEAGCGNECAAHLTGPEGRPEAGSPCDTCSIQTLDDQTAEAGACVGPVTRGCNASLDCALYVNCATQPGCTN